MVCRGPAVLACSQTRGALAEGQNEVRLDVGWCGYTMRSRVIEQMKMHPCSSNFSPLQSTLHSLLAAPCMDLEGPR